MFLQFIPQILKYCLFPKSIFHVHEIWFHYLVQAVGIIGAVVIIWKPVFRESFQCMNRLYCEPGRFIKDFLLNQQWSDAAG